MDFMHEDKLLGVGEWKGYHRWWGQDRQRERIKRMYKLYSGNLYVVYVDEGMDKGRTLCPMLERRMEERTTVRI